MNRSMFILPVSLKLALILIFKLKFYFNCKFGILIYGMVGLGVRKCLQRSICALDMEGVIDLPDYRNV